MQKETKQKKQDLGIFYTDQRIVDFMYGILSIWKEKEDKDLKRWGSRKPHAHYPSVIDPACGEGVFLKRAIEMGFTGYHPQYNIPYVFGVDLDGSVVNRWEELSLLNLFNNNKKAMTAHFYCQNGLIDLPDRKLPYKKQEDGLTQYDAVVGNPPYGGLGIYDDMRALSEAVLSSKKVQNISTQKLDNLFGEEIEKVVKENRIIHTEIKLPPLRLLELRSISKALINYVIWKDKKYIPSRINYPININGVDFNLKDILIFKEIDRLKGFPIEILFLERFIQLAKPGGWIAIIIPDGILTNSNSHYVREFIADRAKVEAIVSLPRDAFKNVGTSAKTSILFLQKYKDQGEKRNLNYPVFLASVESLEENYFKIIKGAYQKHYTKI